MAFELEGDHLRQEVVEMASTYSNLLDVEQSHIRKHNRQKIQNRAQL